MRKIIDKGHKIAERIDWLKPLISAADSFLYQTSGTTKQAPYIRDAVDLKRWMILVVFALLPCVLTAIWNAGVQSFVYSSGNYVLMNEYVAASGSFSGYFQFSKEYFWTILKDGLISFMPLLLISYAVGGACEALFAVVRKTEIAEGFLVTGLLYPLILPPTIPYWMAAFGIAVGIILSKELFGGTGMNILNPALTCRAFLYFAFPASMTGAIWAGTNTETVKRSLMAMNEQAGLSQIDGYSQPSAMAVYHMGDTIQRIQVDAIAANQFHEPTALQPLIEGQLQKFGGSDIGALSMEQLREFTTTPLAQGGLGLEADSFQGALEFANLKAGVGIWSDWNLFLGNKLGSFGEVSILACLLGAFILLWFRLASWRTMLAVVIGAVGTALLFEYGSHGDPFAQASFDFPVYKHFLMGGLAFGLVFMATDPVSGPSMNSAKWFYGILIGMLTIVIRTINPAYPEGIMLAILFGNVFAPLLDYYAVRLSRRRRRVLI